MENSSRDRNTSTCLLRNLYTGQEATVRTRHGTDWFKIGKGVCQGCLFNLCAEYIMPNARLDESQAGINIAGKNINNLRHIDDTTLMTESEVAQSCPTLRDPMDCSLPDSSVHGIFQARVLELGAIAFSGCTLHISKISRVTIYSLNVLLSLFRTSLLFHVQF